MSQPADPLAAIEGLVKAWRGRVRSFKAGETDGDDPRWCRAAWIHMDECADELKALLPALRAVIAQLQQREQEEQPVLTPIEHAEALPCPLCGGKSYATRTVNGTQMFHVGCASCGLQLKAAWYRDEDKPTKDILSLWNTRAAEQRADTLQRERDEANENIIAGCAAHWFTQGGEASFGAIPECTNADELISAILSVVRQRADTLAAELEKSGRAERAQRVLLSEAQAEIARLRQAQKEKAELDEVARVDVERCAPSAGTTASSSTSGAPSPELKIWLGRLEFAKTYTDKIIVPTDGYPALMDVPSLRTLLWNAFLQGMDKQEELFESRSTDGDVQRDHLIGDRPADMAAEPPAKAGPGCGSATTHAMTTDGGVKQVRSGHVPVGAARLAGSTPADSHSLAAENIRLAPQGDAHDIQQHGFTNRPSRTVLAKMYEKLAAENAALRQAQEWRDISSAPKDGRSVLLWRIGWESPSEARWITKASVGPLGHWFVPNRSMCIYEDAGIWLPLPAFPRHQQDKP